MASIYRLSPLIPRHGVAAVSFVLSSVSLMSCKTTKSEPSSEKEETPINNKDAASTFDLTKTVQDWASAADAPSFLKDLINSDTKDRGEGPSSWSHSEEEREKDTMKENKKASETGSSSDFINMAKNFATLLSGGSNQDEALESLMVQARDTAQSGDVTDSHSFEEILNIWEDTMPKLEQMLKDNFASIEFSYFTPAALFYFLESEDERKNPSWKRRMHRYHPGVDVQKVADLNHALLLSELSYDAASTEDLRTQLLNDKERPLKLIYHQPESYPGRPSHFVAVVKGQSMWSNSLEVVVVVRGTKTISDVITDALVEATDYRGGKAHAGILESGKFLVEKHTALLEKLLKLTNKKKIKLHLVGHSLGAGAASIAGLEFNDNAKIEADVVGFGCPALLSKELSEGTRDYITTVVADSDVIPRTSGATLANVALDIMEYDRYPKLKRDIRQALDELRGFSPSIISESSVKSVMDIVDTNLSKLKDTFVKDPTTERITPVLFPPGNCVHFYRDGSGISASIAPCTFFNEIDITRTMVDDHTISTGYRRIFLDLMRQHQGDENFRFEDLTE